MITARIVDLYQEPERYNHVCRATIPAGWAATVEVNDGGGWRQIPKWIADSPADVVDSLKREYDRVVASRRVHDLIGSAR